MITGIKVILIKFIATYSTAKFPEIQTWYLLYYES